MRMKHHGSLRALGLQVGLGDQVGRAGLRAGVTVTVNQVRWAPRCPLQPQRFREAAGKEQAEALHHQAAPTPEAAGEGAYSR